MGFSASWFICLAALAALGLCFGLWLGRGPAHRAWVGVGLGLGLLGVWGWLSHHPTVAVNAIPVNILAYLEGTGNVPVFMLVAGIAWSRAQLPRQRKVTGIGIALGVLFFLNGGIWMLQSTPASSFARSVGRGAVLQSQGYSCVAAACATALNQLGVRTSEAEMAQLTRTRRGTGSTLIRALDGLDRRLAALPTLPGPDGKPHPPWHVELVQPTYEQLAALPMPALTLLHLETTQLHMVVIEKVEDKGVWLDDPMGGRIYMDRAEYEDAGTDDVLVFRK